MTHRGAREARDHRHQPACPETGDESVILRSGWFILLFVSWGYSVSAQDLESSIIGIWQSKTVQSELGAVRNLIEFAADHRYRMQTYFDEAQEPAVTAGHYEIIGQQLVAKALNKGRPIPIELPSGGNRLILNLPGEPPTELTRMQ